MTLVLFVDVTKIHFVPSARKREVRILSLRMPITCMSYRSYNADMDHKTQPSELGFKIWVLPGLVNVLFLHIRVRQFKNKQYTWNGLVIKISVTEKILEIQETFGRHFIRGVEGPSCRSKWRYSGAVTGTSERSVLTLLVSIQNIMVSPRLFANEICMKCRLATVVAI